MTNSYSQGQGKRWLFLFCTAVLLQSLADKWDRRRRGGEVVWKWGNTWFCPI